MDKGTACNKLIIIIINYYTYVYWYLLIHSINEELKEMNNKEDKYAIVVFLMEVQEKSARKIFADTSRFANYFLTRLLQETFVH